MHPSPGAGTVNPCLPSFRSFMSFPFGWIGPPRYRGGHEFLLRKIRGNVHQKTGDARIQEPESVMSFQFLVFSFQSLYFFAVGNLRPSAESADTFADRGFLCFVI